MLIKFYIWWLFYLPSELVETEYQNDKGHPHPSPIKLANDFPRQQHVRALPWPTKSPDMLLFEKIWDVLGCRVCNWTQYCDNLKLFCRPLQEEWQGTPRYIIYHIISSMSKMCPACIRCTWSMDQILILLHINIPYAIEALLLSTWIWGFP